MYEQEDSCIEQEDLMTEYMVYPECDNKILFRVAPSSRRYWPVHELHDPSAFFHHPVTKRASVSAVGKILLQARELVSLLLDSLRRTLEDNVSSSFLARLCFFL